MKHLFLAFPLAFVLSACGQAFNNTACRQAVVEEMKTTDVANVPGKDFSFIARTSDGSVWIVETMSSKTPDVTTKTQLFGPNKN